MSDRLSAMILGPYAGLSSTDDCHSWKKPESSIVRNVIANS